MYIPIGIVNKITNFQFNSGRHPLNLLMKDYLACYEDVSNA
jgi:hypothetical protein